MIRYHVYRSTTSGGPINYAAPVATVSSLSWQDTPGPGSWSYGVRTFDDATGLEESNADAVVTVTFSPSGIDTGSLPPAPDIQGWAAIGPGMARVDAIWHDPAGRTATAFKVSATASGTTTSLPDAAPTPWGKVSCTVPASPGVPTTVTLAASVGGIAGNPASIVVTLPAAAPAPPDSLSATLTSQAPA